MTTPEEVEKLADWLEENALKFFVHQEPVIADKLNAAAAALRDADKMREAIFWALGANGPFQQAKGRPRYWWRNELMKRAGISAQELNERASLTRIVNKET
jgi:hypothetical protein